MTGPVVRVFWVGAWSEQIINLQRDQTAMFKEEQVPEAKQVNARL